MSERGIVAIFGLAICGFLLYQRLDGVAGAGFGVILTWYFTRKE